MDDQPMLIVGGGIGGITAAIALAQKQIPVILFEQATEFADIGAGIQLSPNCSRVLHALGLESALLEAGFLPEYTQFRHWRNGKIISQSSLGKTAEKKFGAPYYHIHRADLLGMLINLADQDPLIQIKLNTKISALQNTANSVSVDANGENFSGCGLIGADGIHSSIRAHLLGPESPTFTGNIAWRALVPTSSLPNKFIRPAATAWWGPKKHFVHYYVSGGAMINCVCVVESKQGQEESWSVKGEFSELAQHFGNWHTTIKTLLEHMDKDNLFKWGLFDRPALNQWSHGRITLLGDACHPTLPFMAQGAAMAIEDAAVIAACLNRSSDIASAFLNYEQLRKKRTAMVQQLSRRNAKVFHLHGIAAWARNRAVKRAGGNTMKKLYAYDAMAAV